VIRIAVHRTGVRRRGGCIPRSRGRRTRDNEGNIKETTMKARIWISALAVSAGICSASAYADVTGKATLEGKAPKAKVISMAAVPACAAQHTNPVYDESIVVGANNELANVVVYVKDGSKLGGQVPSQPAVLDQKGCMYTPHVVAAMVGQELKVKNSDDLLHNVHALARDNGEVNISQNQKGQENKLDVTKAVETFKTKCDVHPWMSAWVVVVDSPYFAVTGEDGTFDIKGLKDGKYTLVAWQEKLGTQEAEVEVKGGKATADFKFAPKKKAAAADPIKEAKETVAVSAPKASDECEFCKESAGKVASSDAAKPVQAQAAAK
jgi:plastocyanin